MKQSRVAQLASVVLLVSVLIGSWRVVMGKPDLWHRPGCHKVGHTRTIDIPDCVQFTISTNACRGFCESFAVPSAPVADGSEAGSSSSGNSNAATIAGELAIGVHQHHSQQQLQPHHSHPHFSHSQQQQQQQQQLPKHQHQQQFSYLVGNGLELQQQQPMMSLPHVTRRRPPTNKPVTSVGQCCNIMESEDVQVQVNCVDGPRNLTFKSATKCACYHCKKD